MEKEERGRQLVEEWKKKDPFLLDVEGFLKFLDERLKEEEKESVRQDDMKLHDGLFRRLMEKNLPEKHVLKERKFWFREIAVGFTEAGVDKEDIQREYEPKLEEPFEEDLRKTYRKMCELNFVDIWWYRKVMQRRISEKYGPYVSSLIKFIDYLMVVEDRVWIIEGKERPNFGAIGQVLVGETLFSKDYPSFEIRKGIVCLERDLLNESTCEKFQISIFGP